MKRMALIQRHLLAKKDSYSNNYKPRFEKQVVIVTGGSNGIGMATCEEFAKEGAYVINADIDEINGQKLINEINKNFNSNSLFVKTDMMKEDSIKNLVNTTISKYGKINVIVNNAMKFILKGFEGSKKEMQDSLDISTIGPFLLTKHSIKYLAETKGSVVNIGSISSFIAQPDVFVYSVGKAAIVQLTKNMALDLAKYGIRVNVVCPGAIFTEASKIHAKSIGLSVDEFVKNQSDKIFLGRMGTTFEIAKAIKFLASNEEASYITGTHLMIDGGYTAV